MTFVRVSGRREGETVWATWEDGRVYGDEQLLEVARLYAERGEGIPLAEGGPALPARLDDPWAFTATMASLVDEPVVSGDDLPGTAAAGR